MADQRTFTPSHQLSRWAAPALLALGTSLLAGCGGSSGNPDAPFANLVEITEPAGDRVDVSALNLFPLNAGDVTQYALYDSDGSSGNAERRTVAAPGVPGAFDVSEIDDQMSQPDVRRFTLVSSTNAQGIAERRTRQLDPLGVQTDAPGIYAALPYIDRQVEPLFAPGAERRVHVQGDAKADFDGDGASDSFYFTWTQTFVGFENMTVLGQTRQVARFRNAFLYAIRGTAEQGDAIQQSASDAYFAPGIGLVRRVNDAWVQDGIMLRSPYEIIATRATVGGVTYTTPTP